MQTTSLLNSKVSIISISYNSVTSAQFNKANLELILSAELKTPFEIIIVDNASSDATLVELQKLAQSYPRLKIIPLRSKVSPIDAMVVAAELSNAPFLFCLDFDELENVRSLDSYMQQMSNCDCIRGVRKHKVISLRRIASWGFNIIFRIVAKQKIADVGNNFYLFNRDVANMLLEEIKTNRQLFLPLLLFSKNILLVEIPVSSYSKGRSSYSVKLILERAYQILNGAYQFRKTMKSNVKSIG